MPKHTSGENIGRADLAQTPTNSQIPTDAGVARGGRSTFATKRSQMVRSVQREDRQFSTIAFRSSDR